MASGRRRGAVAGSAWAVRMVQRLPWPASEARGRVCGDFGPFWPCRQERRFDREHCRADPARPTADATDSRLPAAGGVPVVPHGLPSMTALRERPETSCGSRSRSVSAAGRRRVRAARFGEVPPTAVPDFLPPRPLSGAICPRCSVRPPRRAHTMLNVADAVRRWGR